MTAAYFAVMVARRASPGWPGIVLRYRRIAGR